MHLADVNSIIGDISGGDEYEEEVHDGMCLVVIIVSFIQNHNTTRRLVIHVVVGVDDNG